MAHAGGQRNPQNASGRTEEPRARGAFSIWRAPKQRGLVYMTVREAERRQRQREQSNPVHDRELELARALDDQRVMTMAQWAQVNGFSVWTGQRLIKAGKGPTVKQISDRRIGVTVGANRAWQAARAR